MNLPRHPLGDYIQLLQKRDLLSAPANAPLTRGRFIGQLYEAAGSPAVEIGEALPFADSFGIEWFLPALA